MAEDNSWVFDSLVCFLHGPIWNAPLQTFIEEKSLVFDPNQEPDESNPEYVKIHEEYKNLVDFMLGSFMEEMHITPEQFEIACLEGRNQHSENPLNFHQGLFQQIWAANNIKIFIRMMTQRNVELQLQALDLIERRQNSVNQEETATIEEGNSGESKETKSLKTDEEVEQEISKNIENELSGQHELKEATIIDSNNENKDGQQFKRLNLFFEKQQIDPEDVKSRQEYLRSQRDKILEIKKKARVKQLHETAKKNDRPSSAQVAQKILEGNVGDVLQDVEKNSASLQLRKTLAKRLRAEVVEQH